MKILLLNLGYCSGLDGSFHDYFFHGARYLHTPRRIAEGISHAVSELVHAAQPDICCFLELHKKSALVKDLRDFACSDIEDKYGLTSLLRRLPFFRDNCNGFFSRSRVSYKKLFFRKGGKKLVYELQIGDVSLFLCHFSLSASVRREQFREIEAIVGNRKKTILCGDFNIFSGPAELTELMTVCGFHAANLNDCTFPAVHPTKTFDLFLCTPDIHVLRCESVKNFHGSDHLPVLMEFQV